MTSIENEEVGLQPESQEVPEASGVSADRPLSDPEDDKLGYAPFAKALAEGVGSMSAPDGLVVGIYGAWGLGKTTVLNFVEHYLNEARPGEFEIVRFNPWWFSGRVDIAAAFFDQLRAIFEKWAVRGELVRNYAAELARVVGAVTGTGAGDAAAGLIAGAPADVPELKKQLAKSLADQDKRLLILIDDIDRLTRDEVAELFAVVKALADFPNTIYVLAFDRDQVANALSERTTQAGFDYLEKIVQVPFELPLPERESLRALFFEHLHEIVGQVDTDLLDNEAFGALVTSGLDPLMKTPRDIVRLTNSLRVTYTAVRGEVNVADFIGLEALRVFEPAVYDRIRARPDLFGVLTGLARAFPQAREEDGRTFHSEWLNAIPDAEEREGVKHIVASLFPETAQTLDTRIPTRRRKIDARRARAVSEPEYFPLYFRFALGDLALSRELVAAVVAAGHDSDEFARALIALTEETTRTGRTRASVMLDELNAQAESGFATEHIPTVIRTLTNIGDQLWLDSDDEFFGVDNESRIIWLIGALLARIPEEARCGLLTDAIRNAESVGTPVLLVRRLTRGLGVPTESSTKATPREGLDERQAEITIDCALQLEQVAVERIAAAAAGDSLWGVSRLLWILAEWRRWGEPDAAKTWMADVLGDDAKLGQFMSSVLSERMTSTGARQRLDPRWLDDYADRAEVATAVRRLRSATEDERAMQACDQYLLELEMLQEGKDPEVRFDWD
jgi:predicted KAP-like P-loop ATPase